MKKIILFDTSIGTLNHGDEVIVRSFKNNARELLEKNFVLSFPTHTPCFLSYQQFERNKRFSFVDSADHKFVLGTNIINNYMLSPWPYWNINILNSKCYKNAVLVGVGSNGIGKDNKLRWYSKMLYKSILSNKYTHSVRDERTKEILESIGLKAINTGCPTIWGLTKEHCRTIPQEKRGG